MLFLQPDYSMISYIANTTHFLNLVLYICDSPGSILVVVDKYNNCFCVTELCLYGSRSACAMLSQICEHVQEKIIYCTEHMQAGVLGMLCYELNFMAK